MSKVTIVGVGALGSHAAQLLRNCGANIVTIDFDRIERKNVLSQFHAQNSVGKNKAVALQLLMQFVFGTRIGAIPHRLSKDNDDQLLSGSDLIIDCLDNGDARRLVQNFARRSHVPCLHGTLAAGGQFGRVIWDESFVIDNEDGAGGATCENGDFLPFIAVVSSYVATAAQKFLNSGAKWGFQITPAGTIRV
jgi:molybdopterin/thiamine biosynthesis adenylyltransferase